MIDFLAGDEQDVTAVLPYRLWEKRGHPLGSLGARLILALGSRVPANSLCPFCARNFVRPLLSRLSKLLEHLPATPRPGCSAGGAVSAACLPCEHAERKPASS